MVRIYWKDKTRSERKENELCLRRSVIFMARRQRLTELKLQKLARLAIGLQHTTETRAAFEFVRL